MLHNNNITRYDNVMQYLFDVMQYLFGDSAFCFNLHNNDTKAKQFISNLLTNNSFSLRNNDTKAKLIYKNLSL